MEPFAGLPASDVRLQLQTLAIPPHVEEFQAEHVPDHGEARDQTPVRVHIAADSQNAAPFVAHDLSIRLEEEGKRAAVKADVSPAFPSDTPTVRVPNHARLELILAASSDRFSVPPRNRRIHPFLKRRVKDRLWAFLRDHSGGHHQQEAGQSPLHFRTSGEDQTAAHCSTPR